MCEIMGYARTTSSYPGTPPYRQCNARVTLIIYYKMLKTINDGRAVVSQQFHKYNTSIEVSIINEIK